MATVRRTNQITFTRKQSEQILYGRRDLYMLLKWDSISWQKTLVILDNFVQWLVVNTLFPEMMNHHNQEDGFKETLELDLY